MIVHSGSDDHLELGLYPASDWFEINSVAMTLGVGLPPKSAVCKVCVNIIFQPLTDEFRHAKINETAGGDAPAGGDDRQAIFPGF